MIPDKIYVREYQDGDYTTWWDEKPHEEESIGMKAVCYIRKDYVDEMLKTAKDHAYFAGQEKFREKLIEWVKENRDSLGRLSYGEFIDKLNSM